MPTPIAIAIVIWEGRVLIGQRGPDVPLAGFWEFPGGKVELAETPAEAAARECREETGLLVEVGELLPVKEHAYAHDRVQLHFFACAPREPAMEPRFPFRWVEIESLKNYDFPPANAEVLRWLGEQ